MIGASLSLLLALVRPTISPESLAHWSDGKAELSGYQLIQPRYGELHKGTLVLVFVKEDFSDSARVKADPGVHPAEDQFSVMKLNVIKEFQTGIYRYNLMTSAFVTLEPHRAFKANAPVKVAFTNQEWCGIIFEELSFDAQSIRQKRFSYFDREGDADRSFSVPEGGVVADALPILVRGIVEPLLETGASKEIMILPPLERTRLLHRTLEFKKGRISRGPAKKPLLTPFGTFERETIRVEISDGDRWEFDVERAFPHRILGWLGPDEESAQILGSARLKYWEMHKNGDEAALRQLGLSPPR